MGGVPCAKTIIDQRAGVIRVMDCMATTILLSAPNGSYPTEQMEDEFVAAATKLAEIATRIEQAVRTGEKSYSHSIKTEKDHETKS